MKRDAEVEAAEAIVCQLQDAGILSMLDRRENRQAKLIILGVLNSYSVTLKNKTAQRTPARVRSQVRRGGRT